MALEVEPTLANNRKRRGVVHASMTRLDTRVGELEAKAEALSPGDVRVAQQLLQRLGSLDSDFKAYHFAVIDVIDPESLEAEQSILDEHDDKVANLTVRLQQLTSEAATVSRPSGTSSPSRLLAKRLTHLETGLQTVIRSVDSAASSAEVDACLLLQCEEQLSSLRSQLASVSHDIITYEGNDEASLCERLSELNGRRMPPNQASSYTRD